MHPHIEHPAVERVAPVGEEAEQERLAPAVGIRAVARQPFEKGVERAERRRADDLRVQGVDVRRRRELAVPLSVPLSLYVCLRLCLRLRLRLRRA